MAAQDDFDTTLDETEQQSRFAPVFETPIGGIHNQPPLRHPSSVNPTTARLRRVSTSLLRGTPEGRDRGTFGDSQGDGLRAAQGGAGVGLQQQQAQRQNTVPQASSTLPPPPQMSNTRPKTRVPPPPPPPRQQQALSSSSPQKAKFVLTYDVPDEDMLDLEVSLKKEDYGLPGSSDYRKNRAMATAALSEKFGVARHKILAAAEEGDQSKYSHVQTVIVSILHRVKQGELRAKAVDWMDICTIPFLIIENLSNDDCSTWWDDSEINIWQDWDVLELNQVRRWQYSINKRFGNADRIASNWLFTFVSDSSTDSLRTAVMKKYEKLDGNQRGGVIYLYLTLCEMFQMSREVEEAMFKFIEIFKRSGVSRFTGENVLVVQEEVTGVCKRLDSIGALRSEHVMDILTGLGICSNTKFRDMFKHLKQTAELNHLALLLPTLSDDATPMEQIDAVLDKAVDQYDLLCTAGLWNKATRGGGNALKSIVDMVNICWNCGQKGHPAFKCRKPRDPVTYNKNKKAWLEQKASGNASNNESTDGQKKDQPDKSTPEYQRKQWQANGCTMVNGVLYMNCRVCGLNTNHSSRRHEAYAKNPTSYQMSGNHFYVKECKRLGQGYGGQMKTISGEGTAPAPAPASGGSANMVTFEKNKLESALSDYERNSTNPEASELADMFRSLFLK